MINLLVLEIEFLGWVRDTEYGRYVNWLYLINPVPWLHKEMKKKSKTEIFIEEYAADLRIGCILVSCIFMS